MKWKKLIPGIGPLLGLPQFYLAYVYLKDSFEQTKAYQHMNEMIESDPGKYYPLFHDTAQQLAESAESAASTSSLFAATGILTATIGGLVLAALMDDFNDPRKLSDVEKEIKNTPL